METHLILYTIQIGLNMSTLSLSQHTHTVGLSFGIIIHRRVSSAVVRVLDATPEVADILLLSCAKVGRGTMHLYHIHISSFIYLTQLQRKYRVPCPSDAIFQYVYTDAIFILILIRSLLLLH